MTHFADLYQLAIRILTATRNSDLGRLSLHSGKSEADAHVLLREAICQETMPSESGNAPWAVMRVFMRNLVNRAFAPVSGKEMLDLLSSVEADTDERHLEQRIQVLSKRVAQRSSNLHESLNALVNVEPVAGQSYTEWLIRRAAHYAALPIGQLNPTQVLADVNVIAADSKTKIPNMGVALAANLLADLGATALAKPDKHVILTMLALMPIGSRPNPEACIKKLIEIVQQEAPVVALQPEFRQWLPKGLHPRHFDRLIYLIGSDNFLLDGTQNKRFAPIRRQIMINVLSERLVGVDEIIPVTPNEPAPQMRSNIRPRQNIANSIEFSGNPGDEKANAEVIFFDRLQGQDAALRLVDDLQNIASEESCEVHYTLTDKADIRIRAFRDTPKHFEQNVITLTWQPKKRGFSCELFAQADFCRTAGLHGAKSQSKSKPLPTKVFLDPWDLNQISAFGLAAQQSIRDFQNTKPSNS